MNRVRMGMAAGLVAIGLVGVAMGNGIARAGTGGTRVLGVFGAWQAYTYHEGRGTVCYAAAAADHTRGGLRGRKPTYLAVTDRPGAVHEVSLIGSYRFKGGSHAELVVGDARNAFFTRGNSAWSVKRDANRAIVQSLINGAKAVIHAAPRQGPPVVDQVSLTGFTKALEAIDRACRVK